MGEFRVHHVRFLEFTPSAIHCLAYDETRERLALSRSDGSIEIWSIKDQWCQEKILPPSDGRTVEAILWCRGRLFSAGLHGYLHEHNLLTCEIKSTASSNSGPIWCLALNEQQTTIAAGTEDGCVVLFDVTDTGLEYSRALDKQEGRILSIAWHAEENVIVTGGVDNIRVWSVPSGHAIQRLTPTGAPSRNKETIVWAVAITKDFTIISGDSRGHTSFWNGKHGTQIKSFQSHKADVLVLCVDKAGRSVFASGIDPSIVQFEYTSPTPDSEWNQWVKSSVRTQHSHDVRALALTRNAVVSGGVDCLLIVHHLESKKGVKTWRRISPVPQKPLVYVAKNKHIVMVRYADYLELWRLGSTNRTSDKNGEILQLKTNPILLLQLRARSGEYIVCAAIADSGEWVAYSDQHTVRLFHVTMDDLDQVCPCISIAKVRHLPQGLAPAQLMSFTPDGNTLVTGTREGTLQLLHMDKTEPSLVHTFPTRSDPAESIHLLSLSPSGKLAAVADLNACIHVYNLKTKKRVCTLPEYNCQPTALGFDPSSKLLAVAYADQKVMEYSVVQKEYTDWCREATNAFHPQWLRRFSKITQLIYNPANPVQMFVRDEQMFCIIDKTQPFPPVDKRLFEKAESSKDEKNVKHAFHICSKFKYLLHLEVLADDYLLVVERTPLAIQETLPSLLKQKKFGT